MARSLVSGQWLRLLKDIAVYPEHSLHSVTRVHYGTNTKGYGGIFL